MVNEGVVTVSNVKRFKNSGDRIQYPIIKISSRR